MKISILAILLIAFIGIANASTVTLTGTCYTNFVNQTHNYMSFNLTNSGNGTATDMVIEPIIQGASTTNTTLSIPLVAPGTAYNEKIYLQNFTTPGSYVEQFVASYSQGSSNFITIFPCLVTINHAAPSLVSIIGFKYKNNNLQVNISNIADYPINAQISLYTSPSFTVLNSTQNVTLQKYSIINESFAVSSPKYTDAQFPIAVVVSYTKDNLHYSTLGVYSVSFGGNKDITSIFQGNAVLFIIAAIIIIIIILIIISILKKKPKSEVL